MGIFGKLFGKKKESLTFEEANKIREDFAEKFPPSTEQDVLIQEAIKAMTNQRFAESIKLYERLSKEYPADKATYLAQIGAGNYFLGRYELAFNNYVSALNHGEDKEMMDDNIWEAVEELYKQTLDKSWLQKYLTIFPDGEYKKQAEKLL